MPSAIFPIGCAGSGKTTLHKKKYSHIKRISPDQFRFKILNYPESGIDFDDTLEPYIWKKTKEAVIEAINNGESFYLDCTNLTQTKRAEYYALLPATYEIILHHFQLPLEKILKQNTQRSRIVSPWVIEEKHYPNLEPPSWWEQKFCKVYVEKNE